METSILFRSKRRIDSRLRGNDDGPTWNDDGPTWNDDGPTWNDGGLSTFMS
ncbi:MAG: hypothetical protein GY702_28820 [Desulfobulbaceae bacterium]|nr:hypothetical protein [Desulfobulbaceae bacterium]